VRLLLVFLIGVALVFGLLAAMIVVTRSTERVFVVVDSSFPMRAVWDQVDGSLEDIVSGDAGVGEVALATEKQLVHGWQDGFELPERTPYAPCDFSEVTQHDEAIDADQRVLITTSGSCATDGLTDWRVIVLEP
jgi:hypothetical protein